MPARTDLRTAGTVISDQGAIGSCTANAACEAFEFLEKPGQPARRFSRLFVYYYSRLEEGSAPDDDVGAELRSTIRVLAKTGAASDATWPDSAPESRFSLEPSPAARAEAGQHTILFYYRCAGLLTVKASLAQGFPVAFGFLVPANMMSESCSRDGLVHRPADGEPWAGAHAVLAVGYDDTRIIGHERGAILAQNSWSADWGLDGYFWLPYWFFTAPYPGAGGGAVADDCWTIRRAVV